jgi:predicted MFS family arabinose efflux permease
MAGMEEKNALNENVTNCVLTNSMLAIMAIVSAFGIAKLYYNQPILSQIASTLQASERQISLLPALTQIGFAVGILFIAPLGDIIERQRLILVMVMLSAVSLLLTALSINLSSLLAASFAVGLTSTISPLILPFAATLSNPNKRGATTGIITAAMLVGVLLSRTLSGTVADTFGWRAVYITASCSMMVLAIVLSRILPKNRPESMLRYSKLLLSMFELMRTERKLWHATINGMLISAALYAFWAALSFLRRVRLIFIRLLKSGCSDWSEQEPSLLFLLREDL